MNRIVIIEDHPVLISIYRTRFIAEGFQVDIASDGESGLELIDRIRPNLVVLDLAMPKINGIEVLRRLRGNPLFQTLPVIIFSDSAWQQQAAKEGATVVLSKSTHSPSEVVAAVRKALLTHENQKVDTANTFLAAAAPSSENAIHSFPTEGQVLLVEDHYDIRSAISAALDKSGFRVTGVECHVAAWHQVEEREFDAYLINRVCPDGLGLSLCHELRQLYPQRPIIMYSTAALPISQEQRLHAGASAYLTQAADILNPGRILMELIDESRSTPGHVENKVADLQLTLTT